MIVRLLRGFAKVWTWLVGLFWLGNLAFTWYYEGFGRVMELHSPFNVIYYLAVIATLSPAIGAYMLADRLETRRRQHARNKPAERA